MKRIFWPVEQLSRNCGRATAQAVIYLTLTAETRVTS